VPIEHVADGLRPDILEDERLYSGADLRDLWPSSVLPPLRHGLVHVMLHHRGDPRDVPGHLPPRRDLLLDGPGPVAADRLVDVHVAELVVKVVAEARGGWTQESVGWR
jgi:hypothetical protein